MDAAIETIMYGPYQLTHFVYVVLIVSFIAAMAYLVWYNLRIKRLQRDIQGGSPRPLGRSESIALATEANRQARLHRH